MATVNDSKKGTIVLVISAMVLLVAIVIFAWGKPTPERGGDSVNTVPNEEQVVTGEAGELGPNEISITSENFDQEVVKYSGVVVVDAYAPWCSHCQKVGPILTGLSNEYAEKARFGKMNADNQDKAQKANFDFALKNGLTGYPTVWIYKNGEKVKTLSGERTKEEYKKEIDALLQ